MESRSLSVNDEGSTKVATTVINLTNDRASFLSSTGQNKRHLPKTGTPYPFILFLPLRRSTRRSIPMKKEIRYAVCIGFVLLLTTCLRPTLLTAMENAECFECHADETLTSESMDNVLQVPMEKSLFVDEEEFSVSTHHQNDITCVDCHSDIDELNWDEEIPHAADLKPVACGECHDESTAEFQKSVHVQMQEKGVSMKCTACHGYHNTRHMEGASVIERENSICLKCHTPGHYHDWLPAGDSHFAFVECVVCHAPEVPRYINLRFYDLVTNTFFDGDKLLKTLGLDAATFLSTVDTNNNQLIDTDEFEDLVFMLKQKNIRAILRAELVADINPLAHAVIGEGAIKDCATCHTGNSPFFSEVSIILNHQDGTVDRYGVNRDVLESYHVNHFYLLGGTRVKLLDKIGILILAAGAMGAGLHLFGRLATIRLRRKNKQNH